MRSFGVLCLMAFASPATAAPAADLVVVWAPGTRTAPVEAAARAAGAAVIDRSPAPPEAADTAQIVRRGVDAYKALKFDDAKAALDQARSAADRSGAAGLSAAQLSDLFLYRGLVTVQQGDPDAAWEDFIQANVVDPTRVLDPAVFGPKVIEQFERARDQVKTRPAATLTVEPPAGCSAFVDGTPALGAVTRTPGPHWVRVTCPDRAPWGARVEVATGDLHYPVSNAPYTPPSDTELLEQARRNGARAFVIVEVHGTIGTLRLVGLDGRERDRRSVTLNGDLGPLADALAILLAPPPRHHWYQSRWTWLAGGAAAAAIVLVPLTAVIAGGSGSTTFTGHPQFPGGSPWP